MKFALAFAAGLAVFSAGCKKTETEGLQNSAPRDLTMAPLDSNAVHNDQPIDSAKPETPETKPVTPSKANNPTTTSSPKTSTKPSESTPKPTAKGPSLDAGTSIELAAADSGFSTKTNKTGDTVSALVSADVKDGAGKVVIPQGSKVLLKVSKLVDSKNKSDSGTVALEAYQLVIGNDTMAISGYSTEVERSLKSRSVKAGDAAKVGAGAVAGGVLGKLIGKKKTATVVGAAAGAAVGTAIAVNSADRDVVVKPGGRIVIQLDQAFAR